MSLQKKNDTHILCLYKKFDTGKIPKYVVLKKNVTKVCDVTEKYETGL